MIRRIRSIPLNKLFPHWMGNVGRKRQNGWRLWSAEPFSLRTEFDNIRERFGTTTDVYSGESPIVTGSTSGIGRGIAEGLAALLSRTIRSSVQARPFRDPANRPDDNDGQLGENAALWPLTRRR